MNSLKHMKGKLLSKEHSRECLSHFNQTYQKKLCKRCSQLLHVYCKGRLWYMCGEYRFPPDSAETLNPALPT